MRHLGLIVLYTALLMGANPGLTATLPPGLTGDMQKLVATVDPIPLPDARLIDEADRPQDLAAYRGKVILVNFWATWCAPCRKELASLDRLQADLGGDDFAVVTIATGRNPVPAMQKLFAEEGITHLPLLRDPDQGFARAAGVLGLPVSLVLDRDGTEIARLVGDAEWDSEDAKAVIRALIASP
jgi:thiol-disulfide isomerase/thioredoxin